MIKKIPLLVLLLLFSTTLINGQNALNGEWQLVGLTDEEKNEFELAGKVVIVDIYNQGISWTICNSFDGTFSTEGEKIKFGKIASTLIGCDKDKLDGLFLWNLTRSTSFAVRKNDLVFKDAAGFPKLKFKRVTGKKPPSIIGNWTLVSMTLSRDKAIPLSDKPITLKIEQERASGNGGCNSYAGDFMQTAFKVRFSRLISTKMWCDNAPVESQYLNALEKSVSFEIVNRNLVLRDAKKQNMLVFKRN